MVDSITRPARIHQLPGQGPGSRDTGIGTDPSHMPNEVSKCVLKISLFEDRLYLFSRQGCSDTPLQDHDKSPGRFRRDASDAIG